MTEGLHLSPRHREEIEALLRKHLPNVEIWAYGSRVNGRSHDGSDLDLVLRGPTLAAIDTSRIVDFIETLQDSTIPFLVEARDWACLPESFHREIEREHVVLVEREESLGTASDGWVSLSLGEVCTKIGSGATPRGGKEVYLKDGPYALIRSQNVYNHRFNHDGLAFINQHQATELNNVEVFADDVLLNITGDSVARACQVAPDVLPARVNQHVAIIRPNPHKLSPHFLRYFLVCPEIQAMLLSWAGSGGTRNALTKGMIESFDVQAPMDVDEQRAIAHILGTLDDKIELNRRMNETLEAMARALFKSWFVDFDPVRAKMEGRDTGLPKHLADLFPDRLVDSELGEIPEGWRVADIESLCVSITSGGTPARKDPTFWKRGAIPWYKTGELLDGPLIDSEEYITETAIDNSSTKLWPAGTILFALYASPTVGRLGVLAKPGTANQAVAGLIVKSAYGVPFLRRMLIEARGFLRAIAVGAAQQNINQRILKTHRLIAPKIAAARAYSRLMATCDEQQVVIAEESRTLAGLRDALLPKLVSGELRMDKENAKDIYTARPPRG